MDSPEYENKVRTKSTFVFQNSYSLAILINLLARLFEIYRWCLYAHANKVNFIREKKSRKSAIEWRPIPVNWHQSTALKIATK